MTPASLDFTEVGDTATLLAVVSDANGHPIHDAEVQWSSADSSVATVDRSGLVTATANGRTTITARADSASGTATVSVRQVASVVSMTPASLDFTEVGDTATVMAVVSDANGHPIHDAAVQWSSADSSVATVDRSGLVTATANGRTTITARARIRRPERPTVSVRQVASVVSMTPASLDFTEVGDTATVMAVVSDANGHPIHDAEVRWSSADSSVATVDPDQAS